MSEPAAAPVAPAPTTTMLEIAGLDAFYGKARVLDDLSFTMERGSLAIVGRNGMGKTTLCNAIMGIAPPHAEGSSITTRRGFVTSARPIASICCSPPESCAPPLRLRSASRGKSS